MKPSQLQVGTCLRGHVDKVPTAVIAKQPVELRAADIQVTVGDEEIPPTIVVQIDKGTAPTAPRLAQGQDSAFSADVHKLLPVQIAEQFEGLATEACHHNVGPAVSIVVTKICIQRCGGHRR
jgi:hypothetical protein